jgi:hypothetical protein
MVRSVLQPLRSVHSSSTSRLLRFAAAAFKILVFHGQLLGALLSSNIVLPRSFLGISAGTSTATSFQMSSLLAVQCLVPNLSDQVALTVATPALFACLVVLAYAAVRGLMSVCPELQSKLVPNEVGGGAGPAIEQMSEADAAATQVRNVHASVDQGQVVSLDPATRLQYRFLSLLYNILNLVVRSRTVPWMGVRPHSTSVFSSVFHSRCEFAGCLGLHGHA